MVKEGNVIDKINSTIHKNRKSRVKKCFSNSKIQLKLRRCFVKKFGNVNHYEYDVSKFLTYSVLQTYIFQAIYKEYGHCGGTRRNFYTWKLVKYIASDAQSIRTILLKATLLLCIVCLQLTTLLLMSTVDAQRFYAKLH